MFQELTVMVPSRGRPDNIKRLIDTFSSTKTDLSTKLVVAVDSDDPKIIEYVQIDKSTEGEWDWLQFLYGVRLRLGGTLNAMTYLANFSDVLGFMGDDHLPRTFGWDNMVLDAMQPGGVVYGNDLIHGPGLPTAVFMDSAIINALGYFVPPGLTHLYFDNTWKDWGEATGRLTYLPDMIIEHLHPIAGKVAMDEGYAEVNSGAMYEADGARYAEYKTNGEFAADVEKLRAL